MSDSFAHFAQARYFGVKPVGRIVGYAEIGPSRHVRSHRGREKPRFKPPPVIRLGTVVPRTLRSWETV